MRIDQYLWCVRYFKSRSQASAACKKGSIRVNDQTVKPSRIIYLADTIQVRKNQVWHTLQIVAIPKSRVAAKLVPIYAKNLTPQDLFYNQEMQRLSKNPQRDPGAGRPTKKERREIDAIEENGSENKTKES